MLVLLVIHFVAGLNSTYKLLYKLHRSPTLILRHNYKYDRLPAAGTFIELDFFCKNSCRKLLTVNGAIEYLEY